MTSEGPAAASIVRRRASDIRLFGAAGYALALQISHPTVAAGVREHSSFRSDPWTRFFATADFLVLLIYGGSDVSAAAGARLREFHRHIQGTDPTGHRYTALEPGAYAWVHATLAEAIVRGHAVLGTPLSSGQCAAFWGEWLELGHGLGVGRDQLPPDWLGLQAYLAAMIADVLEDNDVVHDAFATARRGTGGSPFAGLDPRLWAVAGRPLARYGMFLATGLMPPALRAKLGLRWSPVERALFEGMALAHRSSGRVLPLGLRQTGPVLLRVRPPIEREQPDG